MVREDGAVVFYYARYADDMVFGLPRGDKSTRVTQGLKKVLARESLGSSYRASLLLKFPENNRGGYKLSACPCLWKVKVSSTWVFHPNDGRRGWHLFVLKTGDEGKEVWLEHVLQELLCRTRPYLFYGLASGQPYCWSRKHHIPVFPTLDQEPGAEIPWREGDAYNQCLNKGICRKVQLLIDSVKEGPERAELLPEIEEDD